MTAKSNLIELLAGEDHDGLRRQARNHRSRVMRFLLGRLCSVDELEMQRAVRALGALVSDRESLAEERVVELLRRLFWALNDESGAVPYGAPEAIGEILAQRPETQPQFLGLLCGFLTHEEIAQTGPIERGVIWALGRVAPAVRQSRPEVVVRLEELATGHRDAETRELASRVLDRVRAVPQAAERDPAAGSRWPDRERRGTEERS